MSVGDKLPLIEIPPDTLSTIWNTFLTKEFAVDGSLKGEYRKNALEFTGRGSINAQFRVKPQIIHSASTITIAKAEFQATAQSFYSQALHFRHAEIPTQTEVDEISKYALVQCPTTKVASPKLEDFLHIEFIFGSNIQADSLLCKVLAIVPDVVVTMRPIKGFAIVTTTMSIRLLKKAEKEFETGFLTLDQESRVVPLHQSDPKAKLYTLIGIWVSGLEVGENSASSQMYQTEDKAKRLIQQEDQKAKSLNNPRVLAAILRFLFTIDIKSRMSPQPYNENPLSFLLVNFSTPLPQFLEVRLKDRENRWMAIESSCSVSRYVVRPVRFQLDLNAGACSCYSFFQRFSNQQDTRCRSHREMSKENVQCNYKVEKNELTQRLPEQKLISSQSPLDLPFKIPSKMSGKGSRNLYETMQLPSNCLSEFNGTLILNNKAPAHKQNTEDPSTNKAIITPKQQTSVSSSATSSGMYSTQHARYRARQRLGTYSWGDQFPSYSGNVSLVRTSEYGAVSSASKNSSFLGHIVVEQQKQIQALQLQLASLVEAMKSITKNGSAGTGMENVLKGYESKEIMDEKVNVNCTSSFKNAARMIANEDINLPLQNSQRKKSEVIHLKKHKGPIILKKSQVRLANGQERNLPDSNHSIKIRVQAGNTHSTKQDLPMIGSTVIKIPNGRLSNIKEINESVSTILDDEMRYREVYTKPLTGCNEWSIDLPRIYYDPSLLSLIHICRCRRYAVCRSRWSPYH
eukprot:TRINITY_DN9394_c0_g2_i9.p1 TRINITY_DN9394_c0_g2~~TRINITY_DN9394_c0_g2_i9.p1  ORF type:complete len:742 (+),score=92.07 TRINITY_DN9394_c0_g2_i9:798-3023(+)